MDIAVLNLALTVVAGLVVWIFQRVDRSHDQKISRINMLTASLKAAEELKDDLLKEFALKVGYGEKLDGREIEDIAKRYPGRAIEVLRSYNHYVNALQWSEVSKKFEYRIKAPFLVQIAAFSALYFALSVPATFLVLKKVVPVIPTLKTAPEYAMAIVVGSVLWVLAIASALMVFNLIEARQFARKINRDAGQ